MFDKLFAWLGNKNKQPARHSELYSEALSAIYTLVSEWDKTRDTQYEPRDSVGLTIFTRFVSAYEMLEYLRVLVPAVRVTGIVTFTFEKKEAGVVSFGDWMTHEGSHLNFELLLAAMLENVAALQREFVELELVEHEHLSYYRRMSKPLIRDLNNLVDILRELE